MVWIIRNRVDRMIFIHCTGYKKIWEMIHVYLLLLCEKE